ILRVSKQIGMEATSVLYEHNAFIIILLSPVLRDYGGPAAKGGPQALIRRDDTNKPLSKPCQEPRVLYPHVLRRMSNLEILVWTNAVWGSGMMNDFFSHVGELLLELLQLLSQDEGGPESCTHATKKKRLGLKVRKAECNDGETPVLFPRSDGSPNFRNRGNRQKGEKLKAAEMSPLVDAISQR
ncbi:MAG: hypothetical protein Q9183_008041, partial [Haloplaca sp. 2 TL-2023]